jgi:chaperonin GroES
MFRLVDDKIAVSFDGKASDETSKGGIVLPNVSDEMVSWDGDEARLPDLRMPMLVKEGDKVLISAFTGTEIDYEGKSYKIMNEMEVVAIL